MILTRFTVIDGGAETTRIREAQLKDFKVEVGRIEMDGMGFDKNRHPYIDPERITFFMPEPVEVTSLTFLMLAGGWKITRTGEPNVYGMERKEA